MPKFVVEVIGDVHNMTSEEPWKTEVYRGDNPKEALFAWAVAEYCAPMRVSINSYRKAHAKELILSAKVNNEWLREQCSLKGFPYKWEMIENVVNDKHDDGCRYFRESKFMDCIIPFNIGA